MPATEHVDVLVIGAGLSGIGAACHLRRECPSKTMAILEARESIGGTWDLFRYPGIRCDSDMYTLGYSFEPWTEPKAIADGASVLEYVRHTAYSHRLNHLVRVKQRAVAAAWSSTEGRWTVTVQRVDTAETHTMTCAFLYLCTGYFDYEQGYTPEFEGSEDFTGQIVHPQHWPDDLDYDGKQVVVIGSGATAITLVPAMAAHARHVTMVQRSPSYLVSMSSRDALADRLRKRLPTAMSYSIVRWKNVLRMMANFELSRRAPGVMKAMLRKGVQTQLPDDYDIDTHFTPTYNPWDQRLCLVRSGDFFTAIRRGQASVVTDRIDRFTPTGLRLASGRELNADVIVTATGFNLLAFGAMSLTVDGVDVDVPNIVMYKAMMLAGVPNLAFTVGYTNASWTLKADLVAQYVCRLINHMDNTEQDTCTPLAPDSDVQLQPVIDFNSGYVNRGIDKFPKQGSKTPWKLHQNYPRDVLSMRHGSLRNGVQFSRAR